MKKSILIVLASILLYYPISLMGADYETPHEFKSGDTISAEMMNELFENIKLSKTVILSSDLVGTWSCKVSVSYSNTHDPGWTDDRDNLSSKLTSELTFSADGDGTYSYQSSAPNPFYSHDDRAIASGYKYLVTSNSFYAIIPRKQNVGDESLASFVRRRMGEEALRKMAEPMLAGIYASDPEKMSIASTFPMFVETE